MANNHSTLISLFADIADAIRAKTGGTESIVADQFPEAIAAISSGAFPSYALRLTANTGNTHTFEIDTSKRYYVITVAWSLNYPQSTPRVIVGMVDKGVAAATSVRQQGQYFYDNGHGLVIRNTNTLTCEISPNGGAYHVSILIPMDE